jgi:hypothetical protein
MAQVAQYLPSKHVAPSSELKKVVDSSLCSYYHMYYFFSVPFLLLHFQGRVQKEVLEVFFMEGLACAVV